MKFIAKKIVLMLACAFFSNMCLEGASEKPQISSRFNLGLISSVAVSFNNRYYATVFYNGILQVWKLYSKKSEGNPIFFDENVTDIVVFNPDCTTGTLIAYGLRDGFVKISRIEDGKCLGLFRDCGLPLRSVAFSPDGQSLVTASSNEICMWDLRNGISTDDEHFITPEKKLVGHNRIVTSLQWSSDGRFIASADESGNIIVWDVQNCTQLYKLDGDGTCAGIVSWSQDSRYLAVGTNKKIIIYVKDEHFPFSQFYVLQENINKINSISWNLNGNLIVTVADEVARLWDMQSGLCLRILSGFINYAQSAAFSIDGNRLLVALGRIIDNRVFSEVLEPGKCAICKSDSRVLFEKDPYALKSCLICESCKSFGREGRVSFVRS